MYGFFKIFGMDVLEVFLGDEELFIIEDVMDKIEYIGLGVIEGGYVLDKNFFE